MTTFVDFPTDDEGLDLSPYVDKSQLQLQSSHLPNQTKTKPNSKGTGKAVAPAADQQYMYDLVGVINHYGTMTGGHYTAYAKRPAAAAAAAGGSGAGGGQWYCFDDDSVTEMDSDNIASSAVCKFAVVKYAVRAR